MHKIPTHILKVFELRLKGYSYEQISQLTRYKAGTLRHYLSPKGKWYQAYRDWSAIELKAIHETTHDMLIAQAKAATEHVIGLLDSDSPSVSLRAAQDILDRCGFAKRSDAWKQKQGANDMAEQVAKWFESKGTNVK